MKDKLKLYQKLFELRKEIGKVSKDSKNPFFKSAYFDINQLLSHIQPLLDKNKLLLLQPLGDDYVSTQIIDIEEGNSVESKILLPQLTDPQKLGSTITYYRRYTLASLLGVQAEDDDGNKASQQTSNKALNWLNEGSEDWKKLKAKVLKDPESINIDQIKKFFKLSKATEDKIVEMCMEAINMK